MSGFEVLIVRTDALNSKGLRPGGGLELAQAGESGLMP